MSASMLSETEKAEREAQRKAEREARRKAEREAAERTKLDDAPELLTVRELAYHLRYQTPHVIYVAVRNGKLRAVRAGETGGLRIRKADAKARRVR